MSVRQPYDPRTDFYRYAPMNVLTRELEQAVIEQFMANGNQPLTQAQVQAITGPQPPILTGIKRLVPMEQF
jgi:hypothetical protein